MRLHLSHRTVLRCWHPCALRMYATCTLDVICSKLRWRDGKTMVESAKLFRPFQPMVGQGVQSISSKQGWLPRLVKKLDADIVIEEKLDGERMLVHFRRNSDKKGDIDYKTYSRSRKESTSRYENLLGGYLDNGIDKCVEDCILDGEIMTWDSKAEKYGAFGENVWVAGQQKKNPTTCQKWLCFVVFDIVHLNGDPLTGKVLEVRKDHLKRIIHETPTRFEIAPVEIARRSEGVEKQTKVIWNRFLAVMGVRGEGLMLKKLKSHYKMGEDSRREGNWYKMKPDYMDSASDTIDVAIVGAYYGKGDWRKDKAGKFLVAVRDVTPDRVTLFRVCTRIGTGFNKEQQTELWNALRVCNCPDKCTRGCNFENTGASIKSARASTLRFLTA